MLKSKINYFNELLNKGYDFSTPFPMAVFGTLRDGEHNNYLMYQGKIEYHCKGFLPNFYCRSIWLIAEKDACAPVEIFFYNKEEWNNMICEVDRLEGFVPNQTSEYGYLRTLCYVHIIPDEYKIEFPSLDKKIRKLNIDPLNWNQFEKIPCWVYSNKSANETINSYL